MPTSKSDFNLFIKHLIHFTPTIFGKRHPSFRIRLIWIYFRIIIQFLVLFPAIPWYSVQTICLFVLSLTLLNYFAWIWPLWNTSTQDTHTTLWLGLMVVLHPQHAPGPQHNRSVTGFLLFPWGPTALCAAWAHGESYWNYHALQAALRAPREKRQWPSRGRRALTLLLLTSELCTDLYEYDCPQPQLYFWLGSLHFCIPLHFWKSP